MATRKSREEQEFEAFLRAKRGYERKLQDIAWQHEEFWPMLDEFRKKQKKIDPSKSVFELESGE